MVAAQKGANSDSAPNEAKKDPGKDEATQTGARPKKYCLFCRTKTEPKYWDAATLRKYINDRGRIIPRARMGTCAKHQRRLSKQIKYARHLALLPFTARI